MVRLTNSFAPFSLRSMRIISRQVVTRLRTSRQLSLLTVSMPCSQSRGPETHGLSPQCRTCTCPAVRSRAGSRAGQELCDCTCTLTGGAGAEANMADAQIARLVVQPWETSH